MTYKHLQSVEIMGFNMANQEVWEAAKILKPRTSELPKPGDDWHVVRFNADGARLFVHETRIRPAA